MKTYAGLWIDHRKAVVVTIRDSGEEATLTLLSKVERKPSHPGGKHSAAPFEAQHFLADDSRQRKFTGQLDIYYDAVIACVRHVDAVLVFGPGEAKGEFRKRIAKAGTCSRIEEAETVDKLTDRQIAARVRQHFQGELASGSSTKRNR